MPTYEFRCPDGTIIERIYKISEAPTEIPSPNGDGMAVRIISGGAGLLFKGSGFYITDYRSDSYRNAAKADGGSGDSKPASSTPAAPAASTSSTSSSSSSSTSGSVGKSE